MNISLENASILIVDDTLTNLDLLATLLKQNGYRVRPVISGEMALSTIEKSLPDLILLDIMMPEMTGFEVCEHLKAQQSTADIPIIFISALNDTDNIVKAFDIGGVDYITKPFKRREVLARVEAQLTLVRQRQQLEAKFQRDMAYLKSLGHMKEQFIRSATHDLKNPLQVILGYVAMFEDIEGAEFEKYRDDFLISIRRNIQKMQTLITDMLELAEIETGVALNRHPILIDSLLLNSVKDFQTAASEKNIVLELHPGAENILIYADAKRITSVLDNLISNAIKYTPEDGKISVSTLLDDEKVVLSVADSGFGIPKDALPHLFDPFYRVVDLNHRNIEGNGIGLSIVKTIVEQHDAIISVQSVLDEGSTFVVHFPILQPEEIEED